MGISGEKVEKVGFFCKMAAPAILDDPKITFDRISRHFRSIRNFLFFEKKFKMAAGRLFGSPFWAILDDRKSLSIAFLAISDQYATFFIFCTFLFKMAAGRHFGSPFWPFWMTENHFRSNFSPFQINTQLFFFDFFFQNGRQRPFFKSDLRQKQ